jgi:hypothetical protein
MIATFAAAGLAEAAWAMEAGLILLAMGVVGLASLVALLLRSRNLAVVGAVLCLLATLFFEPWHCFAPFDEAAYADPDVRSAAGMFRNVGVVWVVTCAAVVGVLLFAFLAPRGRPPGPAAFPEGPERPV